MRQVLRWMTVAVLCCAATTLAGQEPDARLEEAQRDYAQAQELYAAGRYAKATVKAQHALTLREAALGSTHPDVAQSLNSLAFLYMVQGWYGRAEPLFQRALSIWTTAHGKNHPDVATALTNLANLYDDQGLYGRAEPLYQHALAILEATLGKNHPYVAQSLNNLALLYEEQGLYGRAEPFFHRALAIQEEALGKDHPDVAQSLNNLALLYEEQGLYGQAEPLLQRALGIREAAQGKNHPEVATALNNLANLYCKQGLYGQAEPLYERALNIREATFGNDSPMVASSLNNLANIYLAQGLYSQTEPLFLRALSILTTARGKNHPQVAIALNNLANLYGKQGLYSQAEPLLQRALAINDKALGKNHPEVATALNDLAVLYLRQRLYDRARPLFLRALAIAEATLGKNHPDVAKSLNNLALLYSEQGLYDRARPLFQRALAINDKALGKDHPFSAAFLNNLALLHLAQGRLDEALPLFTRALTASEQRLRHEALGFSEMRLARFLRMTRFDEELRYSLLRAHPDDAGVRRLALSDTLLLKGRSVEELASISRAAYRSLNAGDLTLEHLSGLRTQLARLSLQGPGSLPLQRYQQQLAELTAEANDLETTLARHSAPLRALTALPSADEIVERVAQAMPKDSALVEFIAYGDRPLTPQADTSQPQLRYLALVLFPDATTRAVDLGPAEPIDSAASRLRDALANRDAAFQSQSQALYQLAFQPLLPLLGDTHRLFLSPDGQLALVPFAALHDGQQFLVDAFDFTYVTSGKDLLPRLEPTVPASSVAVFADPDFGASLPASSAPSLGDASAQADRSSALERLFSSLRGDPEHRAWAPTPLPGTRQEAQAIQSLFPQARLYLGTEATKEQLLRIPTPGILHVATHGFFLKDAPASTASRSVGHFGALGEEPLALSSPDPLLNSGLVLAGASAPAPDASSASQRLPERTLATALELAGLNLWGTQLVVLSACDTGRGEVKLGQGVYGLRRAFIAAGAETVVMSLWKVKDDTTPQLMEAYYRNLLAGQGRASALREAMRSLRALQPHPHYWAPFIAMGSDAPLRAASSQEERSLPQDKSPDVMMYEEACGLGVAADCNTLGFLYEEGRRVPHDERRAATLYDKACKAGMAWSCMRLGLLYEKGRGVPQDERRAAALFEQACSGGAADGCHFLGVLYSVSREAPQDERRIATLFAQSCEGGVANGCAILGTLYQEGRGVPQDETHAATLYEQACTGGSFRGCMNLGLLYREGRGVPQNEHQATILLEKACLAGLSSACAMR